MQTDMMNLESQISKNQDKVKYDHERIKELETQREKYSEQQKAWKIRYPKQTIRLQKRRRC